MVAENAGMFRILRNGTGACSRTCERALVTLSEDEVGRERVRFTALRGAHSRQTQPQSGAIRVAIRTDPCRYPDRPCRYPDSFAFFAPTNQRLRRLDQGIRGTGVQIPVPYGSRVPSCWRGRNDGIRRERRSNPVPRYAEPVSSRLRRLVGAGTGER